MKTMAITSHALSPSSLGRLAILIVCIIAPGCHAFAFPFSREAPQSTILAATIQKESTSISSTSAATPLSSPMERVGINSRGAKMNEIDFTLAPSDVSLSRCYQMRRDGNAAASTSESNQTQEQRVQTLSLTRALNTASNRAVRRILLARSWPSAEALNLSLRTVLMQQQQSQGQVQATAKEGVDSKREEEEDKAKCPVPRPILNILMNRREDTTETSSMDGDVGKNKNPTPRSAQEKERQWVETQLEVFKDSYSSVPGYEAAEAYLECILSLATGGVESERVKEVS
jgi:hypothetical protein